MLEDEPCIGSAVNQKERIAENPELPDPQQDIAAMMGDLEDIADSGLVFFNPYGGIEIALDINSAFPSEKNPFFNSKESEEHFKRLLVSEELSAN